MTMIKLYEQTKVLECEICGNDVFKGNDKGPGILVFKEDSNYVITEVHVCCKGECDRKISQRIGTRGSWKDIYEFANPLLFMKNSFAFMNNVQKSKFTDEAFESYKQVLLTGFQYVLREPTKKESDDYQSDSMMPF